MMRATLAAMGGLVAMSSATADVPVPAAFPIAPAQQIVLTIGERVAVTAVSRAEMTPYDAVAARRLMAIPTPDGPVTEGAPIYREGSEAPPALAPGRVTLRMFAVGTRATVLVIENGYDRAVRYRARLYAGGAKQPTDVCIAIPAKPTYEHWPYHIDKLDLDDFAFVPWKEGDPVPCA